MAWRIIRHLPINNLGSRLSDEGTDETALMLYAMLSRGSLFASQAAHEGELNRDGVTYQGLGTRAGNITATLFRIGVNVALHDVAIPTATAGLWSFPFAWRLNRIMDRAPAILSIGWYGYNPSGVWGRTGGHFVVAARRVYNGNIVILDPAHGLVEISPAGSVYGGNGRFEEAWYTT